MPDSLRRLLFADDGQASYTVVDGASCEPLLEKLDESKPEAVCLYAGELDPEVVEVAPHLVRLTDGHPFTEWYLTEGAGKHWGIFARSTSDLRGLRKHFRTFLMVRDPEGKQLYFRYYDPRVLRLYLPTCNATELQQVFGPVVSYLAEDEDAATLLRWQYAAGNVTTTRELRQA